MGFLRAVMQGFAGGLGCLLFVVLAVLAAMTWSVMKMDPRQIDAWDRSRAAVEAERRAVTERYERQNTPSPPTTPSGPARKPPPPQPK